jgi:flagellar biosynthesis component FlhA
MYMSRSTAALMIAGVILGSAGYIGGFGAFIVALFLGAVGLGAGWLLENRSGARPGRQDPDAAHYADGRRGPTASGRGRW